MRRLKDKSADNSRKPKNSEKTAKAGRCRSILGFQDQDVECMSFNIDEFAQDDTRSVMLNNTPRLLDLEYEGQITLKSVNSGKQTPFKIYKQNAFSFVGDEDIEARSVLTFDMNNLELEYDYDTDEDQILKGKTLLRKENLDAIDFFMREGP